MDGKEVRLDYYRRENGKWPFREWFDDLRDDQAKQIIAARLARLRVGNFGSCRPVGHGIHELRIDWGPGYRVYFGNAKGSVILLLGGNKDSQHKDIALAHYYLVDYWRRIDEEASNLS